MSSWKDERYGSISRPTVLLLSLLLGIFLASQVSLKEAVAQSAQPSLVPSEQNAWTYYFPIIGSALPDGPTISFGLNFISSAEEPADEQRYAKALSTGATWNRWPLYWSRIEADPGS
ncbi:MAG: hypothetical protein R3300_19550 [Candidatus Promineifilaceae bacterium]|nr:hypothetical protein [Candidatus Promineifilaceae bacterium]